MTLRFGGTRALCALVVAVTVAVLGGCGTQVAGHPGARVPTHATGPIPWTTAEPSAVQAAHLATNHRTLSIDVQVPSGPNPCWRDLRAVLTDPVPGSVRVQVTFSSPAGDRASGCTEENTATAHLTLPEPLGDRELVVDNDVQFTADGAKPPALRLCGQLGCHPPDTGCTPASYDQALAAVDAPQHTFRGATDCHGAWLVIDFSWRTGPACAGETSDPACSSRLGDRWFFRAEKSGWVPIVSGAAGGCAAVLRVEPRFPASMCSALAPLSPQLHPHYPPPSASASH